MAGNENAAAKPEHGSSVFGPAGASGSSSTSARPSCAPQQPDPNMLVPPGSPDGTDAVSTGVGCAPPMGATGGADGLHLPPVTAAALRELEIPRIIGNPRLRHDLNFDTNLHFKPNTEGERGRRKKAQAERYWANLTEELQRCADHPDRIDWHSGHDLPKLPLVFAEIQTILQTLVPERDMTVVEETFDVPLLMQQIRWQALDYVRLSTWTATLLKMHCAPMRDQWLDDMVNRFRRGVKTGAVTDLVDGIRMLFGVLEAMKLDIANHQVRTMRPLLVEDTAHFEQSYFLQRIRDGRFDTRPVLNWYAQSHQDWRRHPDSIRLPLRHQPLAVFLKGVTESLRPLGPMDLPPTFAFDLDRLRTLRADLDRFLALEVCIESFKGFVLHTLGSRRAIPDPALQDLRAVLLSIMDESHDDGTDGDEWRRETETLVLEMARRAEEVTGHANILNEDRGHDNTLRHALKLRVKSNLRPDSTLWRYLEDGAIDRIWCRSFLQIVRGRHYPWSAAVEDVASKGGEKRRSSSWLLSYPHPQAQLAQQSHAYRRGKVPATAPAQALFASIVQSFTHIMSLHWQVFAPLVYLQAEEMVRALRPRHFEADAA
ncbi:MAG: hypothetical protein M1838_000116 [Thelocarpon superellum]|nr:MAG: hypothetical protein M1838_000116 [Thelocarpon superellum]